MTYLLINDYLTKFPTSNIEKAREFQRNVYFCFIDYTITLKLNIQKIKIMASSPIISWQIDGETKEIKDVKVLVPRSCLTLCNLMNCSPPGSSIHGILQGRGDPGLIPGSGRSPGEGHGYPFQYFCLENSMH